MVRNRTGSGVSGWHLHAGQRKFQWLLVVCTHAYHMWVADVHPRLPLVVTSAITISDIYRRCLPNSQTAQASAGLSVVLNN